jgi:hypothetical protein
MTLLFLISVANCHAQFMATGCAPANDLQFKDQGYLVGNPIIWAPGHTYTFTIDGTYSIKLRGYDGGCPDVAVSAWEWPAPWGPNPWGEGVGPAAQYIHLSNLTYVNPTLTTVTASVDADAPIGYIQLMLVGDADGYAFWGIDIKVPPPPPAPGPISPPQASCPTPAFAPVTATTPVSPSVWFAGRKYPIVITGTGFTTPAKATDSCPATQITVSVETGSVALSEVRVVDSTTITAVVEPAEADPAETVEIDLWGGPLFCGEGPCGMARRAADAAPMNNSSVPPGLPKVAKSNETLLPMPTIVWTSNPDNANDTIAGPGLSGQTRNAVVGQPIHLKFDYSKLPSNITITSHLWAVDGANIDSWKPSTGKTDSPQPTVMDQATLKTYWVYKPQGGSVAKVKYHYCIGIDGPGNPCSPDATANFDISGPGKADMDIDEYTPPKPPKLPLKGIANIDWLVDDSSCDPKDLVPFMTYGDFSGPGPECTQLGVKKGTPGIIFTATGASSKGKYSFVQLISKDQHQLTSSAGSVPCSKTPGLDITYPYGYRKDSSGNSIPNQAGDGPDLALPQTSTLVDRDFGATMYLMWTSETPKGSIPVPLGSLDWVFHASTTNPDAPTKSSWTLPKVTAHGPVDGPNAKIKQPSQAAPGYGYPTWPGPVGPCR